MRQRRKKEKTVRIIGIRHRTKKTKNAEARPTEIAMIENGVTSRLSLPTETDELDFLKGQFPVGYRAATAEDQLANFLPHQIKWKEVKGDVTDHPKHLLREEGKKLFAAVKVPAAFDGLKAGDTVAMTLGGSGKNLAYALSRKAEKLGNGTTVLRVPTFELKRRRNSTTKEDDALLLAELVATTPDIFRETKQRDREIIRLRGLYEGRMTAMKERIACEQRLRQRLIGQIFCSEDGEYPNGAIEEVFLAAKANDAILQGLEQEENERERELLKQVKELAVYDKLFAAITGVGPMIAARLIIAVGDIRQFSSKAKLKAFCGVHVLPDGRFPRNRTGEISNWSKEARQGLYLLAEQFNRRPESEWGVRLRAWKKVLRARHPEAIVFEGKKRYSDGHIHKMALWRTLSKFTEWLFRAWWAIEEGKDVPAYPPIPTVPEAPSEKPTEPIAPVTEPEARV